MTHRFSIIKTWEGLPFWWIQLSYYITVAKPCIIEVRRCDKPKASAEWEQHCQSSLKAVDKHHVYSTVLLPNCLTGPSVLSDRCQLFYKAHIASNGWMPLWTMIGREVKENHNGLLQDKIKAFACIHWEKPPKTSVTVRLHAILYI
jgi:hypothetical protein